MLCGSGKTRLRFQERLAGSTDANEYYMVEAVNEGSYLEIETVNRLTVPGEILDTEREAYTVTGCYFESILKDCIRRNEQREGKARIPATAIAATSNRLELPSWDEGFDELYYVERDTERVMLRKKWTDE